MPSGRARFAAVAHGDAIYAMGGAFGKGRTFTGYGPDEDAWEVLADLPTPRAYFAATVL